MSKKLIYLTSFVLVLSLAGKGWSQASNPSPTDGYLLEDTWASLRWSPGPHAASHDIYFGDSLEHVNHGTGETFRGNQRVPFLVIGFPGFPYPDGLVPGTTYYWRIDEVNDLHPDSPWIGEVWSFMIPPGTAYAPEPADGAGFVEPEVTLYWQSGFGAKLHTVYFGDNFADVSNAVGGHPQGSTAYSPGLLELGKTYYWRVDEFEPPVTHKGDVWSFTVGAEAPDDVVGGTIYVDVLNGYDNNDGFTPQAAFATIQKGIDTAADGGVVLVYPGLYQEGINFLGKMITVQGVVASPAGVPVIWNPGDYAVSFYSGEGPDSILKNFIIRDSFMGVFIAGSSPAISNLTIVGNKYGVEAYADSEPDISNCIFWNNSNDDLFGFRAWYSCIERGGEGNIDADPLFVDPDNGDYHLRSERGRYWPEHDIWVLDVVTSPCIDAGDPDAEVLDEPMPNGGRINIGAYGGTLQASLSLQQPPCLPSQASNPGPANEAVGVETNVILSWTAGSNAVSHDVYFGTGSSPSFVGNQLATQFDPGMLDAGTTYFWRIDEINSAGKTTGEVWRFRAGPASVPPPKGRACFIYDTGVWLDGVLAPISKVGVGQNVGRIDSAGPGGSSRSLPCPGKVGKVQEHEGTFVCYDVLLESGNCISVAECHYFMTESGRWVAVQDLKAQTRLQTPQGSIGIISATRRPMPYVGKVYNLKIEGSDRYLVGEDAVIVRDY